MAIRPAEEIKRGGLSQQHWAGPGSFQYTIASITGVPSAPATVRITVLPAADTLDIVNARFRTSTRRWDVTGTAAVHGPGTVVMVVLVRKAT